MAGQDNLENLYLGNSNILNSRSEFELTDSSLDRPLSSNLSAPSVIFSSTYNAALTPQSLLAGNNNFLPQLQANAIAFSELAPSSSQISGFDTFHQTFGSASLDLKQSDRLAVPSTTDKLTGLDSSAPFANPDSALPSSGTTLVFIDKDVPDYQSLVAGVKPGAKVILLNDNSSGIDQITNALAEYSNVSAVHIISHGSSGDLQLGNTDLNSSNLAAYANELKSWSTSLAPGADILLYGCDVAAGETGDRFIHQIAAITGADVAASTNLTGSAALGGDWVLEDTTGKIVSPIVFTPSTTSSYQWDLATFDWATTPWPTAGSLGPFTFTNVNNSGVNVTISLAKTSGAVFQTSGSTSPFSGTSPLAGGATPIPSLQILLDNASDTDSVTATVSFSTPVTGINFTIVDIDKNNTGGQNYSDKVTVTGNGGTVFPTSITGSGVSANAATGVITATITNSPNTGSGSDAANAVVDFGTNSLSSFSIVYTNSTPLPAGGTNPTTQYIGLLANFGFTAPTNSAPTAVADSASTTAGTPVTLNVLSNDTDPQGNATINAASVDLDPSTAGIQSSRVVAGQGTYTVNTSTGAVTFTPVSTFTGTSSINYTVNDNQGATSNQAAITVTIPTNVAPTAVADSTSTTANTPVTINVLTNDTDPQGNATINAASVDLDPSTAGIQSSRVVAGQGTYTVNTSTGAVTFTPVSTFTGTSSINYTVNDNQGATSNQAAITVTLPNTAPTAVADSASTTAGAPVTLNVLTNDTDPQGNATINAASVDLDPSTPGIQSSLAVAGQGTYTVNTSTGAVTFTPVSTFAGTSSINYTVNDNQGATSNQAAITVTLPNTAPTAVADSASTTAGAPVTLNVLTNDTDPQGNATINAASVDLDPSTPGIQSSLAVAGQGTYTVNTSTGAVTFTPVSTFAGTSSINYTVNDNQGATSNQAAITVTLPNTAPTAVADSASTTAGAPVTLNVLTNDTDPQGNATINAASVDLDPSTPGIQSSLAVAGQGTYTVNTSTGAVTFTPVSTFAGTSSINYTVNDNQGATSNQAAITVTLPNTAPTAVADSASTTAGAPVTLNVLTNDTDPQGNNTINPASVDLDPSTPGIQSSLAVAGQGTYTVNTSTGAVTFTPVSTFAGTSSINYTVNDNQGATSNQAAITVTLPNTAPTAVADSASTTAGAPVTLNVLTNDTDPQGNNTINPASVDLDPSTPGIQSSLAVAGQGTYTVNTSTGAVTFTPVSTFAGTSSINYTVNDNQGATSNQAAITVTLPNTAPTAVADSASTTAGAPVTLNVLTNDTDPQGNNTINPASVDLDPSTPGIQSSLAVAGQGTYTVNTSTGAVTFTPVSTFAGTSSINYTVNDNQGATSNQAAITVTLPNTAPTAVADSASTTAGAPVTLNVLTNDTDPQGNNTINPASVDLDPSTPGIQSSLAVAGQGTYTVNTSTGAVTFTPVSTFAGTSSINYTVNDNQGATSNQAAITVTLPNTAPTAVADSASTTAGAPVTLNVLTNDTDPQGNATINAASVDLDPSTPGIQSSLAVAGQGTYTVNTSTGAVTFTPVSTFAGTSSINYTVNDNQGATSNQAAITVTLPNTAPTAVADSASTTAGAPVTLNVLTNDTDPQGNNTINPASVDLDPSTPGIQSSLAVAGQGTYTVNTSTGAVTFTPVSTFAGTSSINYTVNDNQGATSNQAAITVTLPNTAPTAVADSASTTAGAPVTLNVLTNDTDPQGNATINAASVDLDPSTPGIQSSLAVAGQGTYTVNTSTGAVTFTPVSTFAGTSSINYTVNDNQGATSNQAAITVTLPNTAPTAVADSASTTAGAPVTLNVLTNDTDPQGNNTINPASVDLDPSTPGIQSSLAVAGQGTYTVNTSTGAVTFTPVSTFAGTSSINYTVNDNQGATSNQAAITVTLPNTAPTAVADSASTTAGAPVTLNVLTNDTDPQGNNTINPASVDLDPSTPGIQSSLAVAGQGTYTVNTSTGAVTFTPVSTFAGTSSINYTVNDNQGATSNQAAITVTLPNTAPTAVADSASTTAGAPVTLNVLTNDTDPQGNNTINPASVDLDPSTPGIQSSLAVAGQGTYTVNTSTGAVTFTPVSTFAGTSSINYTVNDNQGATSNQAAITVTLPNTAPTAVADSASTTAGAPVTLNVLTNDTDPQGNNTINPASVDLDPSTPGIQSSLAVAGQGTYTVNTSTGAVTFTPVSTFAGTSSINYTVNDNQGATSNQAAITVTLPNTAPTAVADSASTTAGAPVTLNVLTNDTDPQGNNTINPASVDLDPSTPGIQSSLAVAGQGTYTVNTSTGAVTFTPVSTFAGTSSINYTVNDNQGATSNQAAITVTLPNTAPTAVADSASTTAGAPVTLNVLTNDTDPQGNNTINPASVDLDPSTPGIQSSLAVAGQGTYTVNTTTGQVTFTPDPTFAGTSSINYTVNDNQGATSSPAAISVAVTSAPNSPPVANPDTASTSAGSPVTLNVLTNDTDPQGNNTINPASVDLDPSTPGIQSSLAVAGQGTYTVNTSTGAVTFTPVSTFTGTSSINYTVNDNQGATSSPAVISVAVTSAPNSPPVANPDTASTSAGSPVTLNVLTNDTDPQGNNTINPASVDLDPSTPGIQSSLAVAGQGTYTVNTSTGAVTFTPVSTFTGTSSINYTVNDNQGATSSPAAISVAVTSAPNSPPVANPDTASTSAGSPVTLNVLTNDTDPQGNNTINPASVDLDPSTPGIQSSLAVAGQGTYTVNTSTGAVTFTPVSTFTGTSSINYTVNDNQGATSSPAAISVAVTSAPNSPPVANPDTASTSAGSPVTLNVLTNDTDPQGNATINAASVDLDPSTPGIQSSLAVAGQGTYTVNTSTGAVTFTPVSTFAGTSSINYTVNDNQGATSNQAAITVTLPNTAPTAVADSASTTAGAPVTLNVLTNDTDPQGNNTINPASVDLDPSTPGIQSSLAVAGQGTYTVNTSTGAVTFTPVSTFAGTSSINYTVNDNQGATSNQAAITVTLPNTAPTAVADSASTTAGAPVTLNVLTNDTDPQGNNTINPASVDLDPSTPGIQSSLAVAGQGTYTVNTSTGAVTFTPVSTFAGTSSINYTVNDNQGATSNQAAITVTLPNTAPTAVADSASTTAGAPVTLNVLTNDTDPQGNNTINPASVDLDPSTPGIQSSLAVAGQGTYTVNTSTGAVTFTPVSTFAGTSSINYTVNDNQGATSNQAAITVTLPNTAPTAVADSASTTAGAPVTLNVLTNDTDPQGNATINAASVDLDPSTPGIQSSLAVAGQGTYTVNTSTGAVTFTPVSTFAGTSSINYTVNDNQGATSNQAAITVTLPNTAPTAVADSASTTAGAPVTLNVLTNDTDPQGNNTINPASVDLDPSTPGIQSSLAVAGQGTYTVNTTTGQVTFTPDPTFAGTSSINYTVNDNQGATSSPAAISVAVTSAPNSPPVANPDTASTSAGSPVTLNVLTNDTDPQGNNTINPASVDLDPSTPGIQSSLAVAGQGTYTVNTSTGAVTFTPVSTFAGTSSINYTVNDNQGATSNQAAITVTLPNTAPTAVADSASTTAGAPVTLNVLTNDTDPQGNNTINPASVDLDPSTPGIQSSLAVAGQGTYTVNTSTGAVTFTPVSTFAGTSSINYTVNDNQGATSNQAAITVTLPNTAPTAVADSASTTAGAPVTLNVLTNDTDPQGNNTINPASVDLDPSTPGIQSSLAVAGQGTYTVNTSTGAVTFTPVSTFAGTSSINYTVNDNQGATSNQAAITVTLPNTAPTAVADSASTTAGAPVTLNVLTNDTDPQGNNTINPASVDLDPSTPGIQSSLAVAGQGTYTVNTSTGAVTFTPVSTFAGTSSINYTVNDNQGATSSPAAISVAVTSAPNSPPVANPDTASTSAGSPVTLNVLTNDTDPQGNNTINPASVDLDPSTPGIQSSLAVAGQGTYTVNTTTGQVTFTPDPTFAGTSSINYTVNDNQGATSSPAAISVAVTSAPNSPPVANPDTASTSAGSPVTLNVLTNDTDPQGNNTINPASVDLDPSTPGIQSSLAVAGQGTYTVNTSTGAVTFTPVSTFTGTSSINYTVNDNQGATSSPAVISVAVTSAPNSPPVANPDTASTSAGSPVTLNVLTNDTDPQGNNTINPASVDLDPSTPGIQSSLAVAGQGTYTVDTTTGQVTFIPDPTFAGTSTINYTVNDNQGATSSPAAISVAVGSAQANSPQVSAEKISRVIDNNGDGFIDSGDTIAYTITIKNATTAPIAALEAVLTDPIPTNTTYLPGTLVISNGANAGSKTDATGDDQAEFITPTSTTIFRLGTGATTTTGGTLLPGDSTQIQFSVTINSLVKSGTNIVNQGEVSGSNFKTIFTEDPVTRNPLTINIVGASIAGASGSGDGTTPTTPTVVVPPVSSPRVVGGNPIQGSPVSENQIVDILNLDQSLEARTKDGLNTIDQYFDENFYLTHNPDVAAAVQRGEFKSGFEHFVKVGQFEGRDPSILYDEKIYLQYNPDVAAAVQRGEFKSGFEHFIEVGQYQNRDPRLELFDPGWYLSHNPDVKEAIARGEYKSAFEQFLKVGQFEGRQPSILFDQRFYFENNPEALRAVASGQYASAFDYFIRVGLLKGDDPSQFFDNAMYLDRNPDVAAAIQKGEFKSGFEHYLRFGQYEQRTPELLVFDEGWYLNHNPDVKAAVAAGQFKNGLEQFIQFGQFENRDPGPLFNTAYYLSVNPDVVSAIAKGEYKSAFDHYVRIGRSEGRVHIAPNEQVSQGLFYRPQ